MLGGNPATTTGDTMRNPYLIIGFMFALIAVLVAASL